MVTKADLSRQRVQQKAVEAQQEEARKRQLAKEAAENEAILMARVEEMLDTDLGSLLEVANADGLEALCISYNNVRSWSEEKPSGGGGWSKMYVQHPFALRFKPIEGYPPVMRLVEILRASGFNAYFDTDTVDGPMVPANPGTGVPCMEPSQITEHRIIIDWGD